MLLNFIGPINALGYGVASYNTLKALVKRGHSVSLFPIGQPDFKGDPEFAQIINLTVKNAQTYDVDAPCIRMWHQNQLAQFAGKGDHIGWPIFELDKFSDIELHHLKSLDRLFVCSKWAKQVLINNGVKARIDVVPLGIDPSIFHKNELDKKKRPYWTKKTTVFMNVGKWEIRKGHDLLLEAFCKAFDQSDSVELWMMNHNPFIGDGNSRWQKKYLESPMGPKIKIKKRVGSQHGLREYFNQVDCMVFPARAEGFNLEPLEAMACGARVIATDCTGHTEYLNEKNAYLIDSVGVEPAHDGIWFNGQGNWHMFSVEQIAEKLKLVHEEKQKDIFSISEDEMEATVQKFTWENTAKTIERAL